MRPEGPCVAFFKGGYTSFGALGKCRRHEANLEGVWGRPEEYYKLLQAHGNVYDIDWQAFDFKSKTQALLKSQRLFKLSEAWMLLLNSDQIGFKTTYASGYCYHSVLKRGKRWADFKPTQLPMVSTVKEEKNVMAKICCLLSVLQTTS